MNIKYGEKDRYKINSINKLPTYWMKMKSWVVDAVKLSCKWENGVLNLANSTWPIIQAKLEKLSRNLFKHNKDLFTDFLLFSSNLSFRINEKSHSERKMSSVLWKIKMKF